MTRDEAFEQITEQDAEKLLEMARGPVRAAVARLRAEPRRIPLRPSSVTAVIDRPGDDPLVVTAEPLDRETAEWIASISG